MSLSINLTGSTTTLFLLLYGLSLNASITFIIYSICSKVFLDVLKSVNISFSILYFFWDVHAFVAFNGLQVFSNVFPYSIFNVLIDI